VCGVWCVVGYEAFATSPYKVVPAQYGLSSVVWWGGVCASNTNENTKFVYLFTTNYGVGLFTMVTYI
jgi:hypothetical protein